MNHEAQLCTAEPRRESALDRQYDSLNDLCTEINEANNRLKSICNDLEPRPEEDIVVRDNEKLKERGKLQRNQQSIEASHHLLRSVHETITRLENTL